jgi:hypothetical protein
MKGAENGQEQWLVVSGRWLVTKRHEKKRQKWNETEVWRVLRD